MINLFISTYNETNTERKRELDYCLERNRSNPRINNVYILPSEQRVTFQQLIDLVNETTSEEDINIIANSDIFFEDISYLETIGKKECYALTRWEGRVFMAKKWSQDAWVFRGKINITNAAIPLGMKGCDNAFAFKLKTMGYKISNPSLYIRIQHKHDSNHRTYSDSNKISPPHAVVPPEAGVLYMTSINPFDRLVEQHNATITWMGTIISINTRKEIEILKNDFLFDHVVFVESDKVKEGKYIKLDSFLELCDHISAGRYVIINSDIEIRYNNALRNLIDSRLVGIGVRDNILWEGPVEKEEEFPFGYDAFIFSKEHLKSFRDTEYALGIPWWDFYVPLSFIRNNIPIYKVRGFKHVKHEERYNYDLWLRYGFYSTHLPEFPFKGMDIPSVCTKTKNFIENKLIEYV